MPQEIEQMFLSTGEGKIDPATRVQAGEITEVEINDFSERMATDEFDAAIAALSIPNICVDGRGQSDGEQLLGGNAAGGTFTLVIADALTNGAYRKDGENAKDHAKNIYAELKKAGHDIGVHDDDHATGENCGCGAEDRLDNAADPNAPTILGFIERRGNELFGMLRSLNIPVSEELEAKIISNATKLRAEGYATNGADLRRAAVDVAGESSVVKLTGVHNEVLARINLKPGTTLDRKKIAETFGPNYQAFNVDVPSIEFGVDQISQSVEEKHEKLVAALIYNLATASVLAGPSLRVVVRA